MDNLATVQSIYEAFGKGDLPAILSHLAADVEWERWEGGNSGADAGIPYLQPRTGPSDVAGFFEALSALQFHRFEPRALTAGGNVVMASLLVDLENKANGKRFTDEEVHMWTFNDAGKVTRFRHFVDTSKHIAAMR